MRVRVRVRVRRALPLQAELAKEKQALAKKYGAALADKTPGMLELEDADVGTPMVKRGDV